MIEAKQMRTRLLLIAAPAALASFAILALAAVGKNVLLMQLVALVLACLIAFAGRLSKPLTRRFSPSIVILVLTLIVVALPLLLEASGPNRWLPLGPLKLYVAPLVLPAFVAACAVEARRDGGRGLGLFVAAIGVSVLLALQPDASQALALLVGLVFAVLGSRAFAMRSIGALIAIALVTVWAFSKPDPLEPIPHVEGVFALALGHSLVVGCVVAACAIALVAGLVALSRRVAHWLLAVAGYYATLYGCSIAGLTPAPLIGYGAAPLLGYGLLLAVFSWFDSTGSAQASA
jgi:cell division protein FtsW (lipid II flippase)